MVVEGEAKTFRDLARMLGVGEATVREYVDRTDWPLASRTPPFSPGDVDWVRRWRQAIPPAGDELFVVRPLTDGERAFLLDVVRLHVPETPERKATRAAAEAAIAAEVSRLHRKAGAGASAPAPGPPAASG